MTASDIDSYLAGVDEPERSALQELRRYILSAAPQAEQCISYRLPAFRISGTTVAGFGAFKNHLSYLPHSGSVLTTLAAAIAGYDCTKSSLHFTVDKPLTPRLVAGLVETRIREFGAR